MEISKKVFRRGNGRVELCNIRSGMVMSILQSIHSVRDMLEIPAHRGDLRSASIFNFGNDNEMDLGNVTSISELVLLGFSSDAQIQVALFVIFLSFYVITCSGNSLIIIVTVTNTRLHTPMYFLLTNLSLLDIIYSTTNVPNALKDLLSLRKTIPFVGCVAQMYISLALGITECFLFTVMAYDRYIAVCYPLHYGTLMTNILCFRAAVSTWVCGFLFSLIQITTTINVPTCGNKIINHFFCEGPAYLSLSCHDNFINNVVTFILGVIILIIPVCFIVLSYIRIMQAIMKMTTSESRSKAFSTCASHLIAVTLYFGSCSAMYMKPQSYYLPERDKIIAVFYIIATPMLNPLIYTLRNREINLALRKLAFRKYYDKNICIK
ncbi:olfactory receptor 2G3-like [Hyla sarda]|uniref:olfactory receptor 2G3-like n=1 Tax=Hyla sarda TaxID=327740 RepID=UPI0024C39EAA|nr:olfactory receptor 2G3-like [Hyla sarda]